MRAGALLIVENFQNVYFQLNLKGAGFWKLEAFVFVYICLFHSHAKPAKGEWK